MKNKSILKIGISLVIAILLFVVLIMTEQSILSDYEKVKVVVVKQDVPKGTEITSENVDKYFKEYEVDKNLEAEGSFKELRVTNAKEKTDKKDEKVETSKQDKKETCTLEGYVTLDEIKKNEILNEKDLRKKNDMLAGIDLPTEVTFKVNTIDASLGGSLRSGTMVDITVYSNRDQVSNYVLKNAYIYKAMAENGQLVGNDDTSTNTTMFTVIVDRSFVTEFYAAMQRGEVSLAWPSEPGEYTEFDNGFASEVEEESLVSGAEGTILYNDEEIETLENGEVPETTTEAE